MQGPQGAPLAAADVAYFSRSHVQPTAHLTNHFMTTGTRRSKSRFIDYDGDGRVDLLEAGWNGTGFQPASIFLNHGGAMLPGIELGAQEAEMWRQETAAEPTGFSAPREWGWQSRRDVADLDGDGIPEFWNFDGSTFQHHRDSDHQPMRLMSRIRNGRGATIDVSYAASTDSSVVTQTAGPTQNGERHAMPRSTWVVKSMSVSDQWDPDVTTTSYRYKHPVWKPDDDGDWDFRGFEEVTTTAPSSAYTVDTYGYSVDWSGRLASTYAYSAEDQVGPRTMKEYTWQELSLFGGAIKTYHVSHEKSWTCNNGDNYGGCKQSYSGFVHRFSYFQQLPLTGAAQLYFPNDVYTTQSEGYVTGDRHSIEERTLVSDADDYRVRTTFTGSAQRASDTPHLEIWTSYATHVFDPTYRVQIRDEVYFERDTLPYDRAVTEWTHDMATGVTLTTRAPRNYPSGPVESYSFDATQRFQTGASIVIGTVPHVVERKYEPGTGALLTESGPNSSSCGSNCTNWSQTWTDVDGMGRPIATWVNRAVAGNPIWQKTQTSWTTYVDAVVSNARTRVVSENLIDYGGSRKTRAETQLDGQGRPDISRVKTNDATLDAVTTYDYDHRGSLVAVTLPDPSQNSSATVTYSYGYDSLGRPTSMLRPVVGGGAASGMTLAYNGLVHTREEVAGSQGGPGAKTVLVHDRFARLVEVREYKDATNVASTTYAYDARDTVTRIQNPDTTVTELFHDLEGRRTSIVRGGRTWSYGYNPSGEMISEAAPPPSPAYAAAFTTSFAYDALGRPTSRAVAPRQLSSGDLTLFGIGTVLLTSDTCTNGVGRLCAVKHPNGVLETSLTYDAEGNPASETRQFSFAGVTGNRSTMATFGPLGKLVTQKYADNSNPNNRTTATYGYDDRGLPATVQWTQHNGPTKTVAIQTRNVAGLVTRRQTNFQTTNWHELRSDWVYDPLTRVTSQTIIDNYSGFQLAKQQLDYFGQDDPSRLRHWMGTAYYDQTFTFDQRHQLASVHEAANRFNSSYTFLDSGKLARATVTAAASPPPGADVITRDVNYIYATAPGSDPDQVVALNHQSGASFRGYTYDSAGNTTTRTAGTTVDAFVYDGEDQLRRATLTVGGAGQGKEEYFYDNAGQRAGIVKRNASGVVQSARVFLGDTELTFNASGGLTKSYAHISLGTPVARVTDRTSIGLQYHGLANNTLLSVLTSGQVISGFVYAPYGELRESTGNFQPEQHRRFNDKYRDDLTKLSYYGARYYDGVLLKWTQSDPLYRTSPDLDKSRPRTALLYDFVGSNPIRYLDPDGRGWRDWVATGLEVVGGVVGGAIGCAATIEAGCVGGAIVGGALGAGIGYDAGSLVRDGGDSFSVYGHLNAMANGGTAEMGSMFFGRVFRPLIAKALAGRSTKSRPTGSFKVERPTVPATGGRRTGRGANKLTPDPKAEGAHTTIKRDPDTRAVTGHAEWDAAGNPVKRTDVTGAAHGPVETPHTHEYGPPNVNPATGRSYPGNETRVRPATPDEIPRK